MRIDAFGHFVPPEISKELGESTREFMINENICDIDARVAYLTELGIDKQVLVAPGGGIEQMVGDRGVITRAMTAHNDGMARLAEKYPDRVVPLANVSLQFVEDAVKEADRAVNQLGLTSVSIHTNAGGHLSHDPELFPFYELMNDLRKPIWVHVSPHPMHEDLPFRISSTYGWPFNSTVLMHCLVFGGVFDRFPNLTFVIHHAGGMLPFFQGRVANSMARESSHLKRPHMDYFREHFYVDSVVQGSVGAMQAAYSFFGPEHLMFGTDMPFINPLNRAIMASIEALAIPPSQKEQIFSGNIRKLIGI